MTYYISDDGDDDLQSIWPMTRDEMLAAYPEMSEDNPTLLADLYVDFHDFDQIEFLVFKGSLSSAVLSAAAARRGIDEALARFETKRKDGSHRIPGWEGESRIPGLRG